MVILMNARDMPMRKLHEGDYVTLETIASDSIARNVRGLRLKVYDIPEGCIAGYYPECNPPIPLWHHAKESMVPAAKSIPVRMVPEPRT